MDSEWSQNGGSPRRRWEENQSGRHGRSVSALIFLAAEDRGLQEAISPAEGFAGASQPLGHGVHHTDRKEPDCMQYQQDREQVYLHIHLTRKQFSYTISYIYTHYVTLCYVKVVWRVVTAWYVLFMFCTGAAWCGLYVTLSMHVGKCLHAYCIHACKHTYRHTCIHKPI